MANSHYIPQLVLRHFCDNGKILYADLRGKTLEQRSTRSVFAERGLYPDWLEKELCNKIEVQFANVLNSKILNQRSSIELGANDMLVLKKFLTVTVLRNKSAGYDDPALNDLTTEEAYLLIGDMCENVRAILECTTKDEAARYLNFEKPFENLKVMTHMRDIFGSYTVFVSTAQSGEDFVMPDAGWSGWEGPLKVRKLNALLETYLATGDPQLADIMQKLTPHDYTVYPLSSNLAVLCVSPFFKLCMPESPYNIIFPEEAPSIGTAMGFGNVTTFQPPKVKGPDNADRRYICEIKRLKWSDVAFLNSLLIWNASDFIGFANQARIQRSIGAYEDYADMPDLSFLAL